MPRWLAFAAAFWLAVAFLVWNGFFDVLVTRGEKQYLLNQARHEAGTGPAASMDGVMSLTIRDAAVTASLWAGLVFACGVGGSACVRRLARREGPPHA
jgi:hypothetical protein